MEQRSLSARRNMRKKTKPKKGRIFLLLLVTLFFVSFAASAYIIIYANQLTFAGDNLVELQKEVQDLKTELARKDSEIEELKLKVANSQSGSHFTGSTVVTPSSTAKPTSSPKVSPTPTVKPSATPTPTIEPSSSPNPTATPKPTVTPDREVQPTNEPVNEQ